MGQFEFKCIFISNALILLFIVITLCSSISAIGKEEPKESGGGGDGGIDPEVGNNKTLEGFKEDENKVTEPLANTVIPHFELSDDPNDVKFLLFRDPRNPNKSEELLLNDTKSVSSSRFAKKEMTVFLIHGFVSNGTSGMPTIVKKGFMDANSSSNIIVVDWGKLSTPDPNCPLTSSMSYPIIVKRNIPIVSQRIGEFIQFLVDQKFTSLKKIHVIGHSLGAHVSGGVGRVIADNLDKNGGRKIARISGLDPAGPLFQGIRVQRRITKADAEFVDIYHTAAGTLGTMVYDEGHANFLPNGGHHQPGCRDMTLPVMEAEGGSCSHSFVYLIYAASIQRTFKACRCDPKFHDLVLETSCPGDCAVSLPAGEPCPSDARGQFYFETGPDPFTDESRNEPELEPLKNTISVEENEKGGDTRSVAVVAGVISISGPRLI